MQVLFIKKNISLISSLLLILLFVYAATSKLLDYQKFRVEIGQSPILTAIASWIAWLVPATGIGISVLLAYSRSRLAALYASFSLMVMFTTYIIAILKFSDYIPCSCGGILQNMQWPEHLIFNIVFVLIAFAGIMLYDKPVNRKNILLQ